MNAWIKKSRGSERASPSLMKLKIFTRWLPDSSLLCHSRYACAGARFEKRGVGNGSHLSHQRSADWMSTALQAGGKDTSKLIVRARGGLYDFSTSQIRARRKKPRWGFIITRIINYPPGEKGLVLREMDCPWTINFSSLSIREGFHTPVLSKCD